MSYRQRVYDLGIWGLGLGYYLFYTPYSGLAKALSDGLVPGVGRTPGTVILPASVLATAAGILGFITAAGWWRYAGRRDFFGLRVPFPRRLTFLSGLCMATIMATTTLAFTFGGVSIVFVLVLLRGGVLIIAPVVDAISRRRVRWFSWAAMLTSLVAVLVILADAANYSLSAAAVADVAAYLTAYFFKFQFMTRLAKSSEPEAARRYFVEEQMVATPFLLVVLGLLAAAGWGETASEFRQGFAALAAGGGAVAAALLVGLFYAGLCVCTTFIFLDRRENTFCVPLHCGSSMLAGVTAACVLTLVLGSRPPSGPQLLSAGLIVVALLFLSPLHHPRRQAARVRRALDAAGRACLGLIPGRRAPAAVVTSGEAAGELLAAEGHLMRRVFLFVCSGNTCRSPMAAEIGNAETARRLRSPTAEAAVWAGVLAQSAGVTARAGSPLTAEAREALGALGIDARPHAARNLTEELAGEVERIYCMTRAQREAVIRLVPAAADKTHCLDPEGDVDDPHGSGPAAYLECARRIRALVCLRFDELSPSMAE